ncbi:MAG: hypothetical protein FWH18_07295 [Marinilabiliaceae bacterium]|nr:hypothetical protein [Marinilabiliaceae bacterium]
MIKLNNRSYSFSGFSYFEDEKLNDWEMSTISSGVTTNRYVKSKIMDDIAKADAFFDKIVVGAW